MRNARLAEWILSLVTTPERASATVGDLLEDRAGAGALRFWTAVLLTTLSLLWRDVAASPLRMAQLAALGLLLQLLLSVAGAIALGLLFRVAILAWSAIGLLDLGTAWSRRTGVGLVVLTAVATWVLILLSQFQVGRVLAKRSPGRELAPCLVTALIGVAVPLLIVLLSDGRARFPTSQPISDIYRLWIVQPFMYQLALLAGAVRIRRQRLSTSN